MKTIAAALCCFTAVNIFAQVIPTEHGLTAWTGERQWFWVAFPDTNYPSPSRAVITTKCEPTVRHIGDHWQITFKETSAAQINPLMSNPVYLSLLKQMQDIDDTVATIRKRISYLENIEAVKRQGSLPADGNHYTIDPLYSRIAELTKVRATLEVQKLQMEPPGIAGNSSASPLGQAQPAGDDPSQPVHGVHHGPTR